MAFKVIVTDKAFGELDEIFTTIAKDSPDNAVSWRASVLEQMQSLEAFPLRHGLAPEAQAVGVQLHQMMHGKYRILYTVAAEHVTIHGIRHGHRRPMRPDELPQ